MKTYKIGKLPEGQIIENAIIMTVDGKDWYVPNDPGNRDWQEYQVWLAAGNTPDPAD